VLEGDGWKLGVADALKGQERRCLGFKIQMGMGERLEI